MNIFEVELLLLIVSTGLMFISLFLYASTEEVAYVKKADLRTPKTVDRVEYIRALKEDGRDEKGVKIEKL